MHFSNDLVASYTASFSMHKLIKVIKGGSQSFASSKFYTLAHIANLINFLGVVTITPLYLHLNIRKSGILLIKGIVEVTMQHPPLQFLALHIENVDLTMLKGKIKTLQKINRHMQFAKVEILNEKLQHVWLHEYWIDQMDKRQITETVVKDYPLEDKLKFKCMTFDAYEEVVEDVFNACLKNEEEEVKQEGKFQEVLQANGQIIRTYSNGTIEEGLFKYFCLDGYGKRTRPDGKFKRGEFKYGSLHGQSKVVYPNGQIKEGQFMCGRLSGKGCITYDLGRIEGEIKDDLLHGQGKVLLTNGKTLEGHFKKGELEGGGKEIEADGTVKEGQFKEGLFLSGKMILPTGEVYEGEVRDDTFHVKKR